MICEKCWADATVRAEHERKPVIEIYNELILERKEKPCTKKEQRGGSLLSHE